MKKVILSYVILTMVFVSCKKDHKNGTVPDKKTYKVNFNVTGFTQQILGSASKQQVNSLQTFSNPLDTAIDVLYYLVLPAGQTTHPIHQIFQQSSSPNFGNISDNLPAGTYGIIFIGGKAGLVTDGAVYNYGYDQPWQDTFISQLTLTVPGGDVNQNVTLNRIVAKLTVNINDVMPANADHIVLKVDGDYMGLAAATKPSANESTMLVTKSYIIPASAKGKQNYQVSTIIFNTYKPITVTISCYDASGTLIAQSIIKNITLQINTQTILSGSVFGTNTGFNLDLSPWDPTPINQQF